MRSLYTRLSYQKQLSKPEPTLHTNNVTFKEELCPPQIPNYHGIAASSAVKKEIIPKEEMPSPPGPSGLHGFPSSIAVKVENTDVHPSQYQQPIRHYGAEHNVSTVPAVYPSQAQGLLQFNEFGYSGSTAGDLAPQL